MIRASTMEVGTANQPHPDNRVDPGLPPIWKQLAFSHKVHDCFRDAQPSSRLPAMIVKMFTVLCFW